MKCETTVVKKYSKDMEQDTLEILPGFTIKQKNSGWYDGKTDFSYWREQGN